MRGELDEAISILDTAVGRWDARERVMRQAIFARARRPLPVGSLSLWWSFREWGAWVPGPSDRQSGSPPAS